LLESKKHDQPPDQCKGSERDKKDAGAKECYGRESKKTITVEQFQAQLLSILFKKRRQSKV
jgi:hypothetical protein